MQAAPYLLVMAVVSARRRLALPAALAWGVFGTMGALVARYGHDSTLPRALTDYVAGRTGYDYNEHGRASNTHTDFVPDEVVDRFCVLGTWQQHVAKLQQLRELGVTHFAGYLMHDNKEETLRMYGEHVIPAMRETVVAKARGISSAVRLLESSSSP